MAAAAKHGRTVKGKRGIGTGAKSSQTSGSKAATAVVPKGKGDGLGKKAKGSKY